MKVVLTEDIPNVGVLGDQVQVKPGFARNYLIPQGKAILTSSKRNKELQHRLEYVEKLRQAAIEKAQILAGQLKEIDLEITKKAGPSGRLFGSVTNKELEDLLVEKDFQVTRKDILPHEPIKTVGTHTVSIKLHTKVKVEVHVKVIAELIEAETPAPEAQILEESPVEEVSVEETEEAIESPVAE